MKSTTASARATRGTKTRATAHPRLAKPRAAKNLHVPLPAELHARLASEAKQLGRPATALARGAIEAWLEQRRQEQIAEDLRAFALKYAGTEFDLDPAFEAAGI